ncbi:MAG TPA: NAD(P)H-dependent oxidoreductase [Candidatus Binatia bacterium]|jgi:chromate reductase|nr:NAD(P)H-dependent oxidoreductase [Candidatus Binatia bacterium]
MSRTVAVIVGSLRKDSFNRRIAHELIAVGPDALAFEIVEIRDLALFDQDLEPTPPASWTDFRTKVRAKDAVLFVTPEYNRSMPGVLKNAIDVGSRPPKENVWNGKPAAVISVTPGPTGAFGANHHLRQSMVSLSVPVMPTPEAYIGNAGKLFDESGALTDDRTREQLRKFGQAFAAWIEKSLRD